MFLREADGQYFVSFPDLSEAITCGENVEQAIKMVEECLEGRKEDGEEIPLPHFENIDIDENEMVVIIEFDSIEFKKNTTTNQYEKMLLFLHG